MNYIETIVDLEEALGQELDFLRDDGLLEIEPNSISETLRIIVSAVGDNRICVKFMRKENDGNQSL